MKNIKLFMLIHHGWSVVEGKLSEVLTGIIS